MGYFDADAEDMLEVYLLETRQLTGQLSAVLLEAEKKNAFAEEDIHSIFRIMHTIKSSSAMMGLQELSSMAHKLEDLFGYYRETYGKIEKAEPELFDLLFAASDYIEAELGRMSQEEYQPSGTAEIEERTDAYLNKAGEEEPDGAEEEEKTEETEKMPIRPPAAVPEALAGKKGTVVRIFFENGCKMENIRAFMLVRQIGNLCTCVETWPGDLDKSGEGSGFISENGVFIRFESEHRDEVLESLKKGLFVAECSILQDDQPSAAEESAQQEKQKPEDKGNSGENREAEFFNVRSDRLDRLQNLSGELMLHMLTLDTELEKHGLEDIKEGTAHQINRLISEMERTVMEMRLVPVNKIVPKLRRILRDICRDQGKEAELILHCEDLEADKSVVEYVSEALMHIIRNAVDHGIESPQEREEAGKSRKGRITFTAENTVGELRLSLSDDGKGIDELKIRERAREKGLFTRPEEEYNSQEIQELIFSPGFTTNEQVTEYSGRGVGLDVVKNILEGVGGNLYIHTEFGRGTTFTIVVPLSLATIECIRFKVGSYRFSMPARHVFQFMDWESSREKRETINGRDYILYEDRMLPLIDLHRFYHLDGETPEDAIVIYMKGNEKEGCILVDSMYEQKRIVVKPLPPLFGLDFRKKQGSAAAVSWETAKYAPLWIRKQLSTDTRGRISMEAYTGKELLCIPGKNKSYAVEIPYITELCIQMQLSLIPCLPDCFAGVCNYKGNIVPVVELEEEKAEGKNRDMVLITEWGKYRMGIHFSGEPYAIFATDKDKIESPEEMEPSGIWIEKDIYKKDNKVVYVIDMEKSIESLVISHNMRP